MGQGEEPDVATVNCKSEKQKHRKRSLKRVKLLVSVPSIMIALCYTSVGLQKFAVGLSEYDKYEGESKSFWTGCMEGGLQMVLLSATRFSCIAIL
jgi:hypothetical protein